MIDAEKQEQLYASFSLPKDPVRKVIRDDKTTHIHANVLIPKGTVFYNEKPAVSVFIQDKKSDTMNSIFPDAQMRFLDEMFEYDPLAKDMKEWMSQYKECDPSDSANEFTAKALEFGKWSKRVTHNLEGEEIGRLFRVIFANQVNVTSFPLEITVGFAFYGKEGSYFDHSCRPNAMRFFGGKCECFFVALRDIYPQEEVTIAYSYIDPSLCTTSRQRKIAYAHSFICKCSSCESSPCKADCNHESPSDKFGKKEPVYKKANDLMRQLMEDPVKNADAIVNVLIGVWIHYHEMLSASAYHLDSMVNLIMESCQMSKLYKLEERNKDRIILLKKTIRQLLRAIRQLQTDDPNQENRLVVAEINAIYFMMRLCKRKETVDDLMKQLVDNVENAFGGPYLAMKFFHIGLITRMEPEICQKALTMLLESMNRANRKEDDDADEIL